MTRLQVGAAEVDITPAAPGPLAGMSSIQHADGVHAPLAARAFVAGDGTRTAVIVAVDVLWLDAGTVAHVRDLIAQAAPGIDPQAVMIACTHTHSAPGTTFFADHPADRAFVASLEERIATAVQDALATRRPAEVHGAMATVPNCTFNRRPLYRNGQVGTHGPAWVDEFVRFEGPADEELQLVVATDDAGESVGGIVSFACHPTLTGFDGVYSADYPGVLVEQLRAARGGGAFAFLQGASANLAPTDPQRPDADARGPVAAERLGRRLAAEASRALGHPLPVDARSGVRYASARVPVRQREVKADQVAAARAFLCEPPEGESMLDANRRLYGFDYTFYRDSREVQEWFARETIGMWEWQQRAAGGALVEELEVQAIALGDVAVVGFPVELFAELGQQLKRASPFPTTIVATQANGWHGYVPTAEAFEHGGYEPRLGYQSRLVPEAGERLVAVAGDLLAELAGHATRSARVS